MTSIQLIEAFKRRPQIIAGVATAETGFGLLFALNGLDSLTADLRTLSNGNPAMPLQAQGFQWASEQIFGAFGLETSESAGLVQYFRTTLY